MSTHGPSPRQSCIGTIISSFTMAATMIGGVQGAAAAKLDLETRKWRRCGSLSGPVSHHQSRLGLRVDELGLVGP